MRKLLPLLSIGYSIVLTILSLWPHAELKDMPSNSDKIFHTLAYMLFTIVWYFTFKLKVELESADIKAIVFAVIFGIVMEILQHTLTQYREADIKDIVANTIGALVGVLIVKLALKMKVKNN